MSYISSRWSWSISQRRQLPPIGIHTNGASVTPLKNQRCTCYPKITSHKACEFQILTHYHQKAVTPIHTCAVPVTPGIGTPVTPGIGTPVTPRSLLMEVPNPDPIVRACSDDLGLVTEDVVDLTSFPGLQSMPTALPASQRQHVQQVLANECQLSFSKRFDCM